MEIETEVKDGVWEIVEYAKCWVDVVDAGWKFHGLENDYVVMSRNGYINRFRNKKVI